MRQYRLSSAKNCEAQARVRRGSARDGSQGKRPQSAGFLISFFCQAEAQISRILTPRFRQREYTGGRNVCIGISRILTLRIRQREFTGGRNVFTCIPRILTPKIRGRDFKTFSPTQYLCTSLPCPAQCTTLTTVSPALASVYWIAALHCSSVRQCMAE